MVKISDDVRVGAGTVAMAFGFVMVTADAGARWLGWDGPHFFDAVGAILMWAALFATMPAMERRRRARNPWLWNGNVH